MVHSCSWEGIPCGRVVESHIVLQQDQVHLGCCANRLSSTVITLQQIMTITDEAKIFQFRAGRSHQSSNRQ